MLVPAKHSCQCVWQCRLATLADPSTCEYVLGTYNVCALWVVGQKVHDSPALLNVGLGVGPQAVNQVGEHDSVFDEEYLQQQTQSPISQELDFVTRTLCSISQLIVRMSEYIWL